MLTDAQVSELYRNPPSRQALTRAEADNARLTFHARVSTQPADAGPYRERFLEWARGILAPDKYERFRSLLTYPLPSTALIQEAADEWNKCFSAQDRVVDVDFGDEQRLADYEAYLSRVGFAAFFENSLFQASLEAPTSVVVVDMPAGPSPRPEPYCYVLRAGQIHHVEADRTGTITALMYETGEGDARRLVVIDDESFRTYPFVEGAPAERPESTGLHYLGYCPASWLWADKAETSPDSLRRQNLLTSQLGALDYFVFWQTIRQYARLTGENPLLWLYTDPCTYADTQGNACNAGFVTFTDEAGLSHQRPCPSCNSNGLLGPGTVVEMTRPYAQPGQAAQFDTPAGFIEPSAELGKLGAENLQSDRAALWRSLTGIDTQTSQREAINEDQVRSQYESRHAVLSYLAENWEVLHGWLLSTTARLRYPETAVSVNVSYGRDFFILTRQQAVAEYAETTKAGLPMFVQAAARGKIQALIVRGNPKAAARMRMLELLEPFPDSPLATVPAGSEAFDLKANFNQYVGRFEAEIGPLETFGALLPMKERLNRISEILYVYVRDFLLRTAVATPGGFSVGDSVMVKPGKEHMPSHKGMTFTIAEIQGDTYALKLPDGSIHKWYTADELMGMSAPKNSPAKAGMAM